MRRINWHRVNVWSWLARNERAWIRTYDHLTKVATQVQSIASATLALQRNVVILHQRLQAVEAKTGITPADPLLVVKSNERMQA